MTGWNCTCSCLLLCPSDKRPYITHIRQQGRLIGASGLVTLLTLDTPLHHTISHHKNVAKDVTINTTLCNYRVLYLGGITRIMGFVLDKCALVAMHGVTGDYRAAAAT